MLTSSENMRPEWDGARAGGSPALWRPAWECPGTQGIGPHHTPDNRYAGIMELELGLLADDATKDASGKLYIWGEFRYILATSVPAIHPRCAIALRYVADAVEVRGKTVLEFEIVDADGKSIGVPRSPKMPLIFQEYGPAARAKRYAQPIIRLQNLILPHFGDYSVHFWVNGNVCGAVHFHVGQAPARKS